VTPASSAGEAPRLPIRILCRTDVDWESAAGRLPRPTQASPAFVSVLESLDSSGVLDVWDSTFTLAFGSFRAQLAQIATANRLSIRDARLSVGFDDFSAWYRSDEDEMIYPIDDDDYFHPDLAGTAPRASDETAIVFWPHLVYTYDDNGSPTFLTRPVRNLLTNNWGVRKSFLKEHFGEGQARLVLTEHSHAARALARALGGRRLNENESWFDVDLEAERAVFLPASFGISLIHVGSMLRLMRVREGVPLDHFRLTESAEIPDEIAWVEPWIRQAEQLFRAVLAG